MEDFLFGLMALVTDPRAILVFCLALIGGLTFGAMPGMSAVTLCALLLPFTAFMEPTYAILLFAVIYVAGTYGGAITAILFNIPGDANNAPSALDGYPMTQQGLSGKAIGAAVICSALGGAVSAIIMMAATEPIARWAVRAFGSPEIFALIIFGLTVAGSVGGSTAWKGWLSVALGLTVATVGTSPGDTVPRFTFDSMYLMGGIQFVPVLLGVFAVSEVFTQGHRMVTGLRAPPKVGVDFPKLIEFWRLRLAIVRSIVIGFFAGLLPGIGATLGSFLSYNEAVRWSKTPEKFGKGELEGVVSAETANNAATGAAMVPLLALGLPGGAVTAMILAAFQIHGMDPGPNILLQNRDLVWVVFVGMFLANLAILVLGYVETKTIVNLLRIPFAVLGPLILVMATVGAFALRHQILDVWVMYAAGIVGYMMRRGGYSMPGLVLGVILGTVGEAAFVRAMPTMGYNLLGFFERPIALLLLIAAALSIVFTVWRAVKGRQSKVVETSQSRAA